MDVSVLEGYMQPGDGLLHGFASGAIAVTPADAAVTAMAEAALLKKPLNHDTFALERTKVATVSPGATEKVWLTAAIFPLSVTSSTRYAPVSTPANVNCPAASVTAALAIFPVTTFRSLTRAPGRGVLSAFQATPTIDVDRAPTAPPTRAPAASAGTAAGRRVSAGSDAWT
jgi:hypothetical protein